MSDGYKLKNLSDYIRNICSENDSRGVCIIGECLLASCYDWKSIKDGARRDAAVFKAFGKRVYALHKRTLNYHEIHEKVVKFIKELPLISEDSSGYPELIGKWTNGGIYELCLLAIERGLGYIGLGGQASSVNFSELEKSVGEKASGAEPKLKRLSGMGSEERAAREGSMILAEHFRKFLKN